MGIIGWLVLGALAGWIASMITGNNREMGAGSNIIVGILGALLGGLIMSMFGVAGVNDFDLRSIIVAILGAVVLLMIVNGFRRSSHPIAR
jgi:uncharacterized membrane protein YeaQ/YmgE (transglycosylase-associated protein family)